MSIYAVMTLVSLLGSVSLYRCCDR